MTCKNQIGILYTTIGSQQEAEQLAQRVLEEQLAACVNILPQGRSIYRDHDQIIQASECYMVFKTSAERLSYLEAWIIQHHPYRVPAILKFTPESSLAFFHYMRDCLLQGPAMDTLKTTLISHQ